MSSIRWTWVLVLALSATTGLATAADPNPDQIADPDPYRGHRVRLVPTFADLTPEEMATVENVLDDVRTAQDAVLPIADRVDASDWEKILVRRAGEVAEFHTSMEEFHGSGYNEHAEYRLGDWSLSTELRRSPRHYRSSRYIGTGDTLAVIEENGNLLEEENTRLRRLSDKIEKSKFACGDFDWVLQLKGMFNKAALEKYVEELGESALAAAPMALLANWSPTLYEIVKFFRGVASGELNAEKIKCGQLEEAFIDVGRRSIRGPGYAACMKANEGAGISHAHRICNEDQISIWDGLENQAGKIVGFTGGLDEPLNITEMIASSIRTGSDPDRPGERQQFLNDTQEQLDDARARLAANPQPPEPPVGAGEDALAAHARAMEAHLSAREAVEELETKVGAIAADINTQSGGVFARLRNGLASNLENIIGNWTADAHFDIQFGAQAQRAFILEHRHSARELAERFSDLLEEHYHLLVDQDATTAELRESRHRLQGFAFGSMNAPWQNLEGPDQSNIRYSFETLDKLAVLWTKWKYAEEGTVIKRLWPDEHEFIVLINLTTEYEVYEYLHSETERLAPEILQAAAEQLEGDALRALEGQIQTFLDLVERERRQVIFPLREAVRSVNEFQLPHPQRNTIHEPGRTPPVVEDDTIRLGN